MKTIDSRPTGVRRRPADRRNRPLRHDRTWEIPSDSPQFRGRPAIGLLPSGSAASVGAEQGGFEAQRPRHWFQAGFKGDA